MNERCPECGAGIDTHSEDHLCRMHRNDDGICTVCGSFARACHIGWRACTGHRPGGCIIDCVNNEHF